MRSPRKTQKEDDLFFMAKTNQWLVILTCLALLLPACLAASSFVYEDILAYPRYRIVLTEEKIPESHVFGDSHEVDKVQLSCNCNN